MAAVRFFLQLLVLVTPLCAQANIQQLYTSGQYSEVIKATEGAPLDAETLFWRGMSLARLERWLEADETLRQGQALAPRDPRFPTELAGVAYRLENYRAARKRLRRVLDLAPGDEYALNFLGSLYLLDSNIEAALAQWNRLDQPRLTTVELPASLHTQPVLLDRALAFSPAATLRLEDIYTSRARLNLLNAFATYDFDLAPNTANDYKLRLRGFEHRGWSGSPWLTLAKTARGLPYQTAFLEYDNGGGNASSLHALARWDPNRRRASLLYSHPLVGEARYRWRFFADGRNERWALKSDTPLTDFQLQKVEAGAGFDSVVNGSFRWGAEAVVIIRSYAGDGTESLRTPDAVGARTDTFFHWKPLRLPARRITLSTVTRLGLASIADSNGSLYGRTESAAQLHWSSANNWNFQSYLSAGVLAGTAPFDELYILGWERDNSLGFRGLRGAVNGRKGSAPVGDRFWLSSTGITRRIVRFSLLDIHTGPFFDTGTVSDRRSEFGSHGVQFAAGLQLELRILGAFGVNLLYGRNLRTGQDLFFSRTYPNGDLFH